MRILTYNDCYPYIRSKMAIREWIDMERKLPEHAYNYVLYGNINPNRENLHLNEKLSWAYHAFCSQPRNVTFSQYFKTLAPNLETEELNLDLCHHNINKIQAKYGTFTPIALNYRKIRATVDHFIFDEKEPTMIVIYWILPIEIISNIKKSKITSMSNKSLVTANSFSKMFLYAKARAKMLMIDHKLLTKNILIFTPQEEVGWHIKFDPSTEPTELFFEMYLRGYTLGGQFGKSKSTTINARCIIP